MVATFRVHDLVRFDPAVAFVKIDTPLWLGGRLQRTMWAVVRRERITGEVAIGIRGATRSERFATSIATCYVLECISPWHIDVTRGGNERLARAFDSVREAALASDIRIAPVGSFGYELGSGEIVTHAASDLDLVVDAAGVSRARLSAFRMAIDEVSAASDVHVDAELVFPEGGVALREVLDGSPSVLFKTADGPRLFPCPV